MCPFAETSNEKPLTCEVNTFWIPARARLAGLGREDELRHSLGAGGLTGTLPFEQGSYLESI